MTNSRIEARIEKSVSVVHLHESTVTKIWPAAQQDEALHQYLWLQSLRDFQPVTLDVRTNASVIVMPRLTPKDMLANGVFHCGERDANAHASSVCSTAQDARYPSPKMAMRRAVLSSLEGNLRKQQSLMAAFPEAYSVTRLVAMAESLLDQSKMRWSSDEVIATDSHCNAFASNIWRLPNGYAGLDNSVFWGDRLLPFSMVSVSALADFVLLHGAEGPPSACVIEILSNIHGPDTPLALAALIVKLLVRLRIAKVEASLQDSVGFDRAMDSRILERFPSVSHDLWTELRNEA